MLRNILAALAATAGIAMNASAMSIVPLELDAIVDDAATVFEGTCLENRVEQDPMSNLVVTYTTFSVKDKLKGSPSFTHVIKQVGGELPNAAIQYRVPGVPQFTVGEDYVVFLAGVSPIGFSSPIGLSQGAFHVKKDGGGRHVGNGRDIQDLTVEDFKQRVRDHIGRGQ